MLAKGKLVSQRRTCTELAFDCLNESCTSTHLLSLVKPMFFSSLLVQTRHPL